MLAFITYWYRIVLEGGEEVDKNNKSNVNSK